MQSLVVGVRKSLVGFTQISGNAHYKYSNSLIFGCGGALSTEKDAINVSVVKPILNQKWYICHKYA